MKAARLHDYGQSLKLDSVPEPTLNGPSDVIVRVGAAGLCRTDLHIIEGQWREKIEVALPYVLGHETAGWVEDVGSAVENVAPGDAVIVHPLITCGLCDACRAGNDMHCASSTFPGVNADGGFAELLRTNARALVKIDLEPRQVAALADAGITAYHAVKKAVDLLSPGTSVAVIGAGGGLGHIAVQVLKRLTPARVIALDTSEQAIELAKEVGADEGVLSDGSHVEKVQQLTDGAGADVVIDFVGEGPAVRDVLDLVGAGGTYSVVGYGGVLEIPTIELVIREINIVGNLVGTYEDLAELMTMATNGDVTLETVQYPLDAIEDAIADFEKGQIRGRAIIEPTNGR
jgi:NAD+-dependent secondary alcohol dehydrogenase Adh1